MATIKDSVFAKLALNAKFVTEEQLQECREIQQEMENSGQAPPRLIDLLCERGYLSPTQFSSLMEGFEQRQKRLFGEIALKWNLITPDQLDECLAMQKTMRRGGAKAPRIGQIMVSKNFLKAHQVKAILEEQNKKIAKCKHCGAQFNVRQFVPGKKLKCGQCGKLLSLVAEDDSAIDVASTVVRENTPTPSQKPPKLQLSNYKILKRLGEDATGTIYKARSLKKKKLVAIKLLNEETCKDKEFMNTLMARLKKACLLKHPNIKRIYGIEKTESGAVVVSEFIEGESLRNILTREERIGVGKSLKIGLRVAKALKFAQEHGVLHGDIRPSNILISRDGKVVVSGLGLATKLSDNILNIVDSGQLAPFYLAPEHVVEDRTPDHRADIYSLGATLYHIMAGRPPFEGQSPCEVLVRFTEDYFPPLQIYNPDVPLEVCKVVEKMLSAEPEERYQTYDEVITALEQPTEVQPTQQDYKIPTVSTEELEKEQPDKSLGELIGTSEFPWRVIILLVLLALVGGGLYIHNQGLKRKAAAQARLFKKLDQEFKRDCDNFDKIAQLQRKVQQFQRHYPQHPKIEQVNQMLVTLKGQRKRILQRKFRKVLESAEQQYQLDHFGAALAEIEKFPAKYRTSEGLRLMAKAQEDILERCRQRADQLMQQCDQAIAQHKFSKARQLMKRIIENFPCQQVVNDDINTLVSMACAKIKKIEQAEALARQEEAARRQAASQKLLTEYCTKLVELEKQLAFQKACQQVQTYLEDADLLKAHREVLRQLQPYLASQLQLQKLLISMLKKGKLKNEHLSVNGNSYQVKGCNRRGVLLGRRQVLHWSQMTIPQFSQLAEAAIAAAGQRPEHLFLLGVFYLRHGLQIKALQKFEQAASHYAQAKAYQEKLAKQIWQQLDQQLRQLERQARQDPTKALCQLLKLETSHQELKLPAPLKQRLQKLSHQLHHRYFNRTDGRKTIYLPFENQNELNLWRKYIRSGFRIHNGVFSVQGGRSFFRILPKVCAVQGIFRFDQPRSAMLIAFGNYQFQINSNGDLKLQNYRLKYFPSKHVNLSLHQWIPFRLYLKDNMGYWSINGTTVGQVRHTRHCSCNDITLKILRGHVTFDLLYITYSD